VYLIHFSTDYVFSGEKTSEYTEEDEPHPLSVYGQSKLEGEKRIMSSGGNNLIVRTSWLYGPFGKNFVSSIISIAKDKSEISVVNDQIGRPTFTYDLLDCVKWLTDRRITGVVHACNSGTCSWFDFAGSIIRIKGISAKIKAIKSDELKRPAKRPKNSVLSVSKLVSLGYKEIRPWNDALKTYIEEYL
jgi:dTDP-4-dehydrorhamnose reductase